MARKYFGTDGVRGEVGQFPITPDFVMKLGCGFGRALIKNDSDHKPTVIIGKDTRISGYMLETALVAGLTAAGIDVLQTGPLPTPVTKVFYHFSVLITVLLFNTVKASRNRAFRICEILNSFFYND